MSTNLLIGYPDIPRLASSISISGTTENSSRPILNVVTGGRGEYFQAGGSAASTAYLQFDMGAGVTDTAEYLFVPNAKWLKAAGANRLLLSGWDGSTETDIIGTSTGLATRTFSGANGDDLMFASGFNDQISGALPSAAYRYFRLRFGDSTATESRNWRFSKAYFGRFFDMGRDPVYPREATLRAQSLTERRGGYNFRFTWRGVTDEKVAELFETILRDIESPVVLYTSSYHEVLFSMRTLHALVTEHSVQPISVNSNLVELTFSEII